MNDIRALVQRLLAEHERVLLAVDGCSGAGKTSCAARLQQEFGATVFHMDDFFLPPHRKTPQRLAQSGGNVDWERVRDEVLLPWQRGEEIALRRYDCRTGELQPPVAVSPQRLTVVEGVYSCHPALREFYHAAVFLRVSPAEQRRRVTARESAEQWLRFECEWIPLEERYFSVCRVAAGCDLCLDAEAFGESAQNSSDKF